MAIQLNGSSSTLRTPYSAAMAVTGNAVTLCAWIRPVALTGVIVGRHLAASTTNGLYVLDVANGVLRMGIGAAGFLGLSYSTQRASGGAIAAGQWSHVAGTYDGTTIRAFLNGAQVGSASFGNNLLTSSTPLSIGAHFNGTSASNFFNGEIEDVRKYSRALSANELQTMHRVEGGDGIVYGLVAQYSLCGNFGSSLAASASVQDIGPRSLSAVNIASGPSFTNNALSSGQGS